MPLNGAGSFTLVSPEFPAVADEVIYADDFNTIMLDISQALSTALYKDGQQTLTANLPMGGYKLTNLGAATANGQAVEYAQWIVSFVDPDFTTTTAGGGLTVTGDLATMSVTLLDLDGSTEIRLPTNTTISGSAVATKAYADSLAMQTALPNQTGNAGKTVITDGTNASWGVRGLKLAAVTGATLDGYCLNGIMASATYTMPNLSSATNESFALMTLNSAVSVPTTINASDGWTIATGWVAGTLSVIAPLSKATAHGMWGSLTMTPPTTISVSIGAAHTIIGSVMMPNSILVVFVRVNGSGNQSCYAVAFDLVNGTAGAAFSVGNLPVAHNLACYKDTSSTFVIGYTGSSQVTVRAFSIAGTTITGGTAVNPGGSSILCGAFIQMAEGGSYGYVSDAGNAYFVTLTSMTVNTGAGTNLTSFGIVCGLQKVTSTVALVVGTTGTTVSAKGRAATLSITGSGVTSTLNAAVESAGTDIKGSSGNGNSGLVTWDLANAVYLLFAISSASAANTVVYGISVSGTTPTWGTFQTISSCNPATYVPVTYDAPPGQQILVYSTTVILFGALAGAFAISRSTLTLTVGAAAQLSGQSTGTFQKDYSRSTIFFVGSTLTDVGISVSGTTISSSEQVTMVPTAIFTSTVNNKANKYSGTWYSWAVTLTMAAAADKAITVSGNNLLLQGYIT